MRDRALQAPAARAHAFSCVGGGHGSLVGSPLSSEGGSHAAADHAHR